MSVRGYQIFKSGGWNLPDFSWRSLSIVFRAAVIVAVLSFGRANATQNYLSSILPPLPLVIPPKLEKRNPPGEQAESPDDALNSLPGKFTAEISPSGSDRSFEMGNAQIWSSENYLDDRILVQPRRGEDSTAFAALHAQLGTQVIRTLDQSEQLTVVGVPEGETVESLIELYERSELVEFAEPDFIVRLAEVMPNDPRFLDASLWGLDNRGDVEGETGPDIDAPEGWETQKSAEELIVAVVDTGVRYTHEDLAVNMWEDPDSGSHGVNVLSGTNDPNDDNGHGTRMAGILGAVGNNSKGIVGVAWKIQIMACKFVNRFGDGTTSDAVACIDYARKKGAKVINASWGIEDRSRALFDAMRRMREAGVIVVAAAGNDARDIDRTPFYPASFNLNNIVSVAATTQTDDILFLSNYGSRSVDLGAPGEQIVSTSFESDDYYRADMGSTSSAAAFVSGAIALVRARYADEDYRKTIDRVLQSVDPVSALKGKSVTGGRLNLRRALGPPVVAPKFWFRPGDKPFTLKMFVSGEEGRTYVVESSTNLVDWEPVFTISVSESGTFALPQEINLQEKLEFFRVFSAP